VCPLRDSQNEARHASSVRLDVAWIARIRVGFGQPVVGNEVESVTYSPSERPRGPVDARIQQGDLNSSPVEAGQRYARIQARPGRRAGLCRVDVPHRIDADNDRIAVELSDRARVQLGRETIQDTGEDELPLDDDASLTQGGEQGPLQPFDVLRPLALLCCARPGGRTRDPLRDRGRREDHDHALTLHRLCTVAEDRVPSASSDPTRRLSGTLHRSGEEESGRNRGDCGES